MSFRNGLQVLAAGALIAAGLAAPAAAQSYPSQNVNVIVAFPAGGLADIIGRLVSTKLEARLKQSFVVENRGGAGGNIAAKAVAGAAPDGYTLLVTTSGLAANLTASKNRGFEQSDLRPVAFVAISPDVIAVHPSNPAKDLKEFIANAKDEELHLWQRRRRHRPADRRGVFLQGGRQGELRARAVPGRRAGDHRDARQSRRRAGADAAADGAADPSRASCAASASPATSAIRRSRTCRPTARWASRTSISGSWVAVFAPGKTPDAVVKKLNAEINAVMKEPDALEKLKQSGFDPLVKNAAETDAYFKSEVASWAKMVNAVGFSN